MSHANKRPFRRTAHRRAGLLLISVALLAQVQFTRVAQVQQSGREPIAYIGHGAMFNHYGQEITPTLSFIREAQAWYRAELTKKLSKAQRAQFNQFARSLTKSLALDEQSQLLADAHLLDWLLDRAKVENSDRIRGKNNLMKMLLEDKLPEKPDSPRPQQAEPFKANPELLKRLPSKGQAKRAVTRMLTSTGGAAYRTECLANGVPVPPDFGPGSAWVSQGFIPRNRLFIEGNKGAQVLTYQSTSPEGMCIALPRFTNPDDGNDANDQVRLDGVICIGKTTSKVCFWDNEKNGVPYYFTRGDTVPISNFGGGTELIGSFAGVCSDCHAGENPYIIHPGSSTILGGLSGAGLPTFADNWHNPIVRSGDTLTWPENPGPMNSPSSCVSCHGTATARGFAGRLPHLSTAMLGYCGIIRTAVGALPLPPSTSAAPNPPPTMPQGNEGGLVCTPNLPNTDPRFIRACTPAMTAPCNADSTLPPANLLYLRCTPELSALLGWCGVAPSGDAAGRGDPHLTTFNGVNYDFQSAGEFVYLRNTSGLEIQTRQAPVATASVVGPNPHTGLTSCVSVNTAVAARVGKYRVSYQPSRTDGQQRSTLELRIDGRLVSLGPRGINLGGGSRIIRSAVGSGIEIYFPDKSRLIVVPEWWESQRVWYLNVDVVNTTAREGVVGAIAPGGWLPTLPDGSSLGPLPASLPQRHIDLNQKFADAWRVNNSTSLFDYTPGTSTATFTNRNWPPDKPPCTIPGSTIPPAKPMDRQRAEALCREVRDPNLRAQCVFDVTVTGEPSFAKAYLTTQRLLAGARAPRAIARAD